MNVTFSQGQSWFGSGRNRHSVEYTEALIREGRMIVSIRQYPNTTVIQYENERNSRKHKITSKIENRLFDERDVKEFLDLLQIPNGYIERAEIVGGLRHFKYPHTIQVF